MSRSFSFPTSTLSLDPSRLLLSNPLEQSPTNLGAYSLALARSSRTLPHVGGHAHAFEDQRGHLRKDSGSSATTTFTTTTTMSSSDDDQAREDGKKFQCPTCHRWFRRAQTIRAHEIIHSNTRPYVCGVPDCPRAFTTSSNAKRHMRTHKRNDFRRQNRPQRRYSSPTDPPTPFPSPSSASSKPAYIPLGNVHPPTSSTPFAPHSTPSSFATPTTPAATAPVSPVQTATSSGYALASPASSPVSAVFSSPATGHVSPVVNRSPVSQASPASAFSHASPVPHLVHASPVSPFSNVPVSTLCLPPGGHPSSHPQVPPAQPVFHGVFPPSTRLRTTSHPVRSLVDGTPQARHSHTYPLPPPGSAHRHSYSHSFSHSYSFPCSSTGGAYFHPVSAGPYFPSPSTGHDFASTSTGHGFPSTSTGHAFPSTTSPAPYFASSGATDHPTMTRGFDGEQVADPEDEKPVVVDGDATGEMAAGADHDVCPAGGGGEGGAKDGGSTGASIEGKKETSTGMWYREMAGFSTTV